MCLLGIKAQAKHVKYSTVAGITTTILSLSTQGSYKINSDTFELVAKIRDPRSPGCGSLRLSQAWVRAHYSQAQQ